MSSVKEQYVAYFTESMLRALDSYTPEKLEAVGDFIFLKLTFDPFQGHTIRGEEFGGTLKADARNDIYIFYRIDEANHRIDLLYTYTT